MKKNLKKVLFLTALITSISSLNIFAMQKNDIKTKKITFEEFEKIVKSKIKKEDVEKIKKLDEIIEKFKDNNHMGNISYDDSSAYVHSTCKFGDEEKTNHLQNYEEFVGQELLTKKPENSFSTYKLKLALIKALEEKNVEKTQNILKKILRIILGQHIANQYHNFDDKKRDILEKQLENGEIARYMDLMTDKFEIKLEKNFFGKSTIKTKFNYDLKKEDIYIDKQDVEDVKEDEETKEQKRTNIYHMYNICVRFLYYADTIINRYTK